jgi:hypothetical protein
MRQNPPSSIETLYSTGNAGILSKPNLSLTLPFDHDYLNEGRLSSSHYSLLADFKPKSVYSKVLNLGMLPNCILHLFSLILEDDEMRISLFFLH